MASQDSHEPPVPPRPTQPHLRSVARTAHAPAPHITEVWSPSRWQGGAAEVPQSVAMDVDLTTEARPHAYPLRGTAPPASLLGLLHTQRRTLGSCTPQDLDSNSAGQAHEKDASKRDEQQQQERAIFAAQIGARQVEKQAESRPGALLPSDTMAMLDRPGQSADARRVADVVRDGRAATSRPGQAGQSPPVTPSLPSLPSTPTRVQPPAEDAPAAAAPTAGRGSATRGRETDEQPRCGPRQRPPPPEPIQLPMDATKMEAAQAEEASQAAPVGEGNLSVALKRFGALVVMDHEADAQGS